MSLAVQAMTLMAWRLSKLYEDGKMSHAMASNVKVLHVDGLSCTLCHAWSSFPADARVHDHHSHAPLDPPLLCTAVCAWDASDHCSAVGRRGTRCGAARLWHWHGSCWAATASSQTSWSPRPSVTWRPFTRAPVMLKVAGVVGIVASRVVSCCMHPMPIVFDCITLAAPSR
jgi:hypothetical protein